MTHFVNDIYNELPSEDRDVFLPYLNEAESLSETNEDEAYLLGIIISNAVTKKELSEFQEEKIHDIIKHSSLKRYYKRQNKPDSVNLTLFTYFVMIFIGLLGTYAGIQGLLNNIVIVGFSQRYQSIVVKGGGYFLVLGLIFLFGGILKVRQEMRRKRLLSSYLRKRVE